ncbi:folylpolyglutamate synthase/dihydrofolate synthase family protein [Acidocella sp.]|uniref:bifunctional folylpolyglutamate synthase/dihydrofolate synthase n=1 Tax=Acidocella sp. TaxID=50710 RepID=UPI00261D5508|nr:folylpolyglutamate synthase/dihydrofolate synthase family protein [Acidocella sp.]
MSNELQAEAGASAARRRAGAALERLHASYPRLIDLSLERLRRLLTALGEPQTRLPPVIHVAGTNGKGSVCAIAQAVAAAAGMRAHVFTSPHLVRFNERIRLQGAPVEDALLAEALDAVERANAEQQITVFEAVTAAALWLFARVPADLCLIEVGLGGRLDATNVVSPAACAITAISLDHQEFLGATLELIAGEKAGIIKPGVPVVTGYQPAGVLARLAAEAASRGAPHLRRGREWTVELEGAGMVFDGIALPRPALAGAHQIENAGIALAALRAAGFRLAPEVMAAGLRAAHWPARLQRLHGRLAALLPRGELWLDGAHNPGGAEIIAAQLREWDGPTDVILGMKQSKDVAEFIRIVRPEAARLFAVAEPGQHLALPVERIIEAAGGGAVAGPDVRGALRQSRARRVLICGSLYLAGEVLKLDDGLVEAGAGR